ncbi:MAG TPA: hypothetical protein VIN70_02045 [Candidatus Limnocylindria bacterium]
MTKPRLWITVAAGSALAIALTTAALGADVTNSNSDSPAAANASLPDKASSVATAVLGALTGGSNPSAAANASLPDKASSVATAVLGALTGGSNPSTAASNGNSKAGEQAKHESDEDTDANKAANENEAGRETGPAGTTSTKPGWGCGDTNHTHSGPPGHPGATSPCDKH